MQAVRTTQGTARGVMTGLVLSGLSVLVLVYFVSGPDARLPNLLISGILWTFATPLVVGLLRQLGRLSPCGVLPRRLCAALAAVLR